MYISIKGSFISVYVYIYICTYILREWAKTRRDGGRDRPSWASKAIHSDVPPSFRRKQYYTYISRRSASIHYFSLSMKNLHKSGKLISNQHWDISSCQRFQLYSTKKWKKKYKKWKLESKRNKDENVKTRHRARIPSRIDSRRRLRRCVTWPWDRNENHQYSIQYITIQLNWVREKSHRPIVTPSTFIHILYFYM